MSSNSFHPSVIVVVPVSILVAIAASYIAYVLYQRFRLHSKNVKKTRARLSLLPNILSTNAPAAFLPSPAFGIACPAAAYAVALPTAAFQAKTRTVGSTKGFPYINNLKPLAIEDDKPAYHVQPLAQPEPAYLACQPLADCPPSTLPIPPQPVVKEQRKQPAGRSKPAIIPAPLSVAVILRPPPSLTAVHKSYAPKISSSLRNQLSCAMRFPPGFFLPLRSRRSEATIDYQREPGAYVKYQLRERTRIRLAQANPKLFPALGVPRRLEIFPSLAFMAAGTADGKPARRVPIGQHIIVVKKPVIAPPRKLPQVARSVDLTNEGSISAIEGSIKPTGVTPRRAAPALASTSKPRAADIKVNTKPLPAARPARPLRTSPPRIVVPKSAATLKTDKKLFPVQGPPQRLSVATPRTRKGGAVVIKSAAQLSPIVPPIHTPVTAPAAPRREMPAKASGSRPHFKVSSLSSPPKGAVMGKGSGAKENTPAKPKRPFH